jgi:hypothetical protein
MRHVKLWLLSTKALVRATTLSLTSMKTSFITSHLLSAPFHSLPSPPLVLAPFHFLSIPLLHRQSCISSLPPHVEHWLTTSAHPIQDGSYRRRQTIMLQPTFLRHLRTLRTPPKNGQIPPASAYIISPIHQDDHGTPVISLALSPHV